MTDGAWMEYAPLDDEEIKPDWAGLLEKALFLRQNGEYAPGGEENWRDWELMTESYLRGRMEARAYR